MVILQLACMYCEKDCGCYTILNEISNMWSRLDVYKKISFVVDLNKKTLILEFKS